MSRARQPAAIEDTSYGGTSQFVTRSSGVVEDTSAIASVANMWSKSGPAFFPSEEAVRELPPGQYTIEYSHSRGLYFRRKLVDLDNLIVLPDSVSEEIITEIELFWDRKDKFRELGFLWKRGILLYGPPGGGKTSALQIISQRIIDRGGLTVYVKDPSVSAEGLDVLRRIEPERPLVVLIEDFDAVQQKHGESDLLAMLDGELQIDNVVFIATTNYPEYLDGRVVNRPSRFDIVKQIGMPTPEARRVYLETVNPRLKGTEELEVWISKTDRFSVAHLKELVVSVEALDQKFEDVLARLVYMIEHKPSSNEDTSSSFGFSGEKTGLVAAMPGKRHR